ncbi:MAG: hypothetical protein QOG10_4908, partial [Kribbellaceae bacterium]|nr:hypothetical protein [Kribbellaceae bacterium]
DEVATVQIDIPSQQVAALLRTTPVSEHDVENTQPIIAPYEEPDPFAADFEDEPIAAAEAAALASATQPAAYPSNSQQSAAQQGAPQQAGAGQAAARQPVAGSAGAVGPEPERPADNHDRRHAARYDEPIGPDEVYDQEADEAAYNEAMYNGYENGEEESAGNEESRPDERQRQGAGKKEHVA